MNNIDVSFIVATRNVQETIAACIDSIVLQTYTNFEIIICDACSLDQTLSILARYNDERIKVVSKPDLGIYDAWNDGILRAKGQWYFFLGADDYLADQFVLENAIAILSKHKEAPIVYGCLNAFDINGHVAAKLGQDWFDLDGVYFKYIKADLPLPIMATFFNENLFINNKFDISYRVVADADFVLRSAKNWKNKPIFMSNLVVLNMGYGGISTNPSTHLTTIIESFRVRWENGLGFFNISMFVRSAKIILLLVIGRLFGEHKKLKFIKFIKNLRK